VKSVLIGRVHLERSAATCREGEIASIEQEIGMVTCFPAVASRSGARSIGRSIDRATLRKSEWILNRSYTALPPTVYSFLVPSVCLPVRSV